MRTFADAFAEPRETGREFTAEVGDESALLQLCITSDGDQLTWEFRTAALPWSDSVQVVRDTFIQPLVEVKQQLETQKLDLVETVLNQSQASAADFGGQHAGGGRRMYGAHGSAASGGSDFSLDDFDARTVAVRSSSLPAPLLPARRARRARAIFCRLSAPCLGAGAQSFKEKRKQAAAPGDAETPPELFEGFAGNIYSAVMSAATEEPARTGSPDGPDDVIVSTQPMHRRESEVRFFTEIETIFDDLQMKFGHFRRDFGQVSVSPSQPQPSAGRSPSSRSPRGTASRSPPGGGASTRTLALGSDSDSDDSDAEARALFADDDLPPREPQQRLNLLGLGSTQPTQPTQQQRHSPAAAAAPSQRQSSGARGDWRGGSSAASASSASAAAPKPKQSSKGRSGTSRGSKRPRKRKVL